MQDFQRSTQPDDCCFSLISRKLCPLPEGRLVVQLLCPFKSERGLVQRGTLSEPIPGWSLLGWVQRRSLFSQKSGHDDPPEPKHLPLGLQETFRGLYIWLNQNTLPALNQSIWADNRGGCTTSGVDMEPPHVQQCYSFSVEFSLLYLVKPCVCCSGVALYTLSLIKQELTSVTVTKTEKPVIYNSNISSFEVQLLKDIHIYI